MHEFRDLKKKDTINIEIYENNAVLKNKSGDISQFDDIALYKFNIY